MNRLKEFYKENINGIIGTIIFHILVFIFLNLSEFKVKNKFEEAELIIDFPKEFFEEKPIVDKTEKNNTENNQDQTNIASNKNLNNKTHDKSLKNDIEEELEKARELFKNVSNNLKREIPTIPDLKMPVKTNDEINPDSIKKKMYSGDSNIEYFLENRYHVSLPIPVYLTQHGGRVKVVIQVNSNGTVTKAEPIDDGNTNEQMLSYAKTAALKTKFNKVEPSIPIQTGYINYRFIAQ